MTSRSPTRMARWPVDLAQRMAPSMVASGARSPPMTSSAIAGLSAAAVMRGSSDVQVSDRARAIDDEAAA